MKGRRRYWPFALRIDGNHWRWRVNDWARVTIACGTVSGTKREALDTARNLANEMEQRVKRSETVNN
jgi:hypothetical protein